MRLAILLLCLSSLFVEAQSLEELNDRGVQLIDEERYQEALQIFEKIVTQSPDNSFFRYNRAIANANLKNYFDALIDFQILFETVPSPNYAFQTGNMYEQLDSMQLALVFYDRAIALDQESFLYFFKRGTVQLKLMNYQAALQDFNASIELNPEYDNAWHNRGIAQYKLGRKVQGCEDWCQALLKGNKVSATHLEKNCKRYPEPCVLKK